MQTQNPYLRKVVSRKPYNLYWDVVRLECGHMAYSDHRREYMICDWCASKANE